jgi:hypothetical protein
MKEYAEARAGSILPEHSTGDLYTGKEFDENSPGNIPLVPDAITTS